MANTPENTPILRDANQKPIPQRWDPTAPNPAGGVGNWVASDGRVVKVEESVLPTGAATNAELQAVKAELAALKAKFDTPLDMKLTGSNAVLRRVREQTVTTVSAGASTQFIVQPSPGRIARLRYVAAYSPAIAGSTGNHGLHLAITTHSAYTVERMVAVSVVGTASAMIGTANNTVFTVGLAFTADMPLVLTYVNNTNMNQTGIRFVYFVYEEEPIA